MFDCTLTLKTHTNMRAEEHPIYRMFHSFFTSPPTVVQIYGYKFTIARIYTYDPCEAVIYITLVNK